MTWLLLTALIIWMPGSAQAAFGDATEDGWWDEFTNNFATDLAPIISLFGEQVTKQFLSEIVSFMDILIFGVAPLGIITAIVSVIRVCGDSFLKSLIGRSREPYGVAEVELCSSTSPDVCELWSNGGICRVFGRPKILEFMYRTPQDVAEYYPSCTLQNGELRIIPSTCGMELPRQVLGNLKAKESAELWKAYKESPDNSPLSGWEEARSIDATWWWPTRVTVLRSLRARRDRLIAGKEENTLTRKLSALFWNVITWIERTEGWPYNQRDQDIEINAGAENTDNGPDPSPTPAKDIDSKATETGENKSADRKPSEDQINFAPYPNLALNLGKRKSSLTVTYVFIAAISGYFLQMSALGFAVWATWFEPKFYKDGQKHQAAPFFGLFLGGTILLFFGMDFCAMLIDEHSVKRRFILLRREPSGQGARPSGRTPRVYKPTDNIFWLQPGGQRVGDQLVGAFAYREPKSEYMTSWKVDKGSAGPRKLVYVAIVLSFVGWICQFIGLRGLHGSVSLYQLSCTVIMTVIRAFIRSSNFDANMNLLKDPSRRVEGHELDWQALEIMKLDSQDLDHDQNSPTGMDLLFWIHNYGNIEQEDPIEHHVHVRVQSHDVPCKCYNGERTSIVAISKGSSDTDHILEQAAAAAAVARTMETMKYKDWVNLCEQSDQPPLELPATQSIDALNLGARLMRSRRRLGKLANDCGQAPDHGWDTEVMKVASQLKEAIEKTADIIVRPDSGSDVGAIVWSMGSEVRQDPLSEDDNKSGLICMLLMNTEAGWIADERQLEAALGLWLWSIQRQLQDRKGPREDLQARKSPFQRKRIICNAYRARRIAKLMRAIAPQASTLRIEETNRSPCNLTIPITCSLFWGQPMADVGELPDETDCVFQLVSLETKASILQLVAQDLFTIFLNKLILIRSVGSQSIDSHAAAESTVLGISDALVSSNMAGRNEALLMASSVVN